MNKPKFKLLRNTGVMFQSELPTYRPILVPKSTVTLTEIAEVIADKSSQTVADVIATALSLAHELNRWLMAGHSVDLGPLGRFTHQIRGKRKITDPEDVSNSDVAFRRIKYAPEYNYYRLFGLQTYQRDRAEEQIGYRTAEQRQALIMSLRNNYKMIHPALVRRLLWVGHDTAKLDLEALVARGLLEPHYLEGRLFYFFIEEGEA